jgi:hypothetical protein
MDFDTIDTDFWSEIQDSSLEIFDLDIPELRDTEPQDFDSFLNSNFDYWWWLRTRLISTAILQLYWDS